MHTNNQKFSFTWSTQEPPCKAANHCTSRYCSVFTHPYPCTDTPAVLSITLNSLAAYSPGTNALVWTCRYDHIATPCCFRTRPKTAVSCKAPRFLHKYKVLAQKRLSFTYLQGGVLQLALIASVFQTLVQTVSLIHICADLCRSDFCTHVRRAVRTFPSAKRISLLRAVRSSVALGHRGHNESNARDAAKWHVPTFLKQPVKSEVGHTVWMDCSKGSGVTSFAILKLLNHWTDGLVWDKPTTGVSDICTENCTHKSVLSYLDAYNFGNSWTNLLF